MHQTDQPLLHLSQVDIAAHRRAPRAAVPRYTSGMVDTLNLTIVYEPDEDGWIMVSIPEIPGVLSQGRTREEARENVIDALALMLSPEPGDALDEREREALQLKIAA
jgi:predicted RNase H-like HicB family nuclease